MQSSEVRASFLSFFEEKGHTVYPSDLIYPQNDPSLLFTSAGMTQFKDMFRGVGRLPFERAVTSQKCLRMPDIEKVGKTAVHHTFFEMLGNFSFGNYFKQEAIAWAWELLLERWGLGADRLVVTIYEDDDEAYGIWNEEIGVPEDKILRFGESENFWPANAPSQGPNGVCGPCSEIHYDYGEDVGCGRPDCDPSCECDRFMEIWNLVFTQFDRLEGGKLEPLPSKNIDTGLGLERAVRLMQGKRTNFETDLFVPTIERLCDIAGITYDSASDQARRIRRVSDHMRALVVAISDGVIPTNEGRRLLRRAVADGNYLGVHETFLSRLIESVIGSLGDAFPELRERRGAVDRILRQEEEKFRKTLDAGTAMVEECISDMESDGDTMLEGEQAFKLYDTYGFPIEMTRDILEEHGLSVNMEEFQEYMEGKREESRASSSMPRDIFAVGTIEGVVKDLPATRFVGYEALEAEAKVVALATAEGEVDSVSASDDAEVSVLLDVTPFYGEAGGQVGDVGTLTTDDCTVTVAQTIRVEDVSVHQGQVTAGTLSAGDTVTASVCAGRRVDIAANHTATHLLHWALRSVLGEDATQSGSLVAPDRLRFDFAHDGQVPAEKLATIERMVNEKILEAAPIDSHETSLDEARAEGVTALFGEKYGERVRVVGIGDFSRELCGGTHLANVGMIGTFKITSEEGIAAGIRRITAVTRLGAYEAFHLGDASAGDTAKLLGVKREELPDRVAGLVKEIRDLKKELTRKKTADLAQSAGESETFEVGSVSVVVRKVPGGQMGGLRSLADELVKGKGKVGLLVGTSEKGVAMVVCASADVVSRGVNAGEIAKQAAALLGGGGGGRPNMGQAGGPKGNQVDAAVEEARRALTEALA